MRQTEPNRRAMSGRRTQQLMDGQTVRSLIDQAKDMGFVGDVFLSYYNEPLLDRRIHRLCRYAKDVGFASVQICSNGDLLSDRIARRLDGNVDVIRVSLYDDNTKARKSAIRSMFAETRIRFTRGLHRWTHYEKGAKEQIAASLDKTCTNVRNNMIVAFNGDVIACCDEIVPHFDIGNVHRMSLAKLWERKHDLMQCLKKPGGRRKYAYCKLCPRNRQARAIHKVIQ